MFGTSAAPPNANGDGKDGDDDAGSGDGETSHPWGGGGGNPSSGAEGDKGGSPNWQSSSSLSWLTNLRKGIMSGGERNIKSRCPVFVSSVLFVEGNFRPFHCLLLAFA